MIVPAQIRRQFDRISPHIQVVGQIVRDTVFGYCGRQGYAYSDRTKHLESLAEKIETGRFKKWTDLDDLFACTIVVPTLMHEPDVLKFLSGTFVQVDLRQRGTTRKPPDAFRFEATRFIGRLRPPADPSDSVYTIPFEVQVRTAFEHAWSVTTHAIYKSGKVDWKAKRLAAQLKAAVEQMDSLVMAYEESSRAIVEHNWPELATQQEIIQRLEALAARGDIPEEVVPKDWSRFAENFSALVRGSKAAPRDGDEFVLLAVRKFEAEIISVGARCVPRALSLLQYGFGFLVQQGTITPPLRRFCPLVTDELLELFPATAPFKSDCFLFDD